MGATEGSCLGQASSTALNSVASGIAKKIPRTPQPAKQQYRADDRHRVQANRLGEQQRHQHVAIERLDDRVHRHQIDELVAPAPLEQRDQGHRHGHHHRSHIGHHHRQPHQQGQQRRIVEPQADKGDVRGNTADQDLDTFAADVIGDLPVHFIAYTIEQCTLTWQVATNPMGDQLTILEEEEHRDRHQHRRSSH